MKKNLCVPVLSYSCSVPTQPDKCRHAIARIGLGECCDYLCVGDHCGSSDAQGEMAEGCAPKHGVEVSIAEYAAAKSRAGLGSIGNLSKPPLGVPPVAIWREQRVLDLCRAIYECLHSHYRGDLSGKRRNVDQKNLLLWIEEVESSVSESYFAHVEEAPPE